MSIPPIGGSGSPTNDNPMQQAYQKISDFESSIKEFAKKMESGPLTQPEALHLIDLVKSLKAFLDSHKQLLSQMEHVTGSEGLSTAVHAVNEMYNAATDHPMELLSSLENGNAGFVDQMLTNVEILKSSVSRPL